MGGHMGFIPSLDILKKGTICCHFMIKLTVRLCIFQYLEFYVGNQSSWKFVLHLRTCAVSL
jgi:hypothetical protein